MQNKPSFVLEHMAYSKTKRTTLKRLPERGRYEADLIHGIIDEALICHVAFVVQGQAMVLPTIHARMGRHIYLHGSPSNQMLRSALKQEEVCVTMTLLDGLVLARSAFHHSMNYRSVMLLGTPVEVTDSDEKMRAFAALVDHVVPGRWEDCRQPTREETLGTLVIRIPIDEASAKIRSGPPADDAEDMSFPCWAGVIPTPFVAAEPEKDPKLRDGIGTPPYLENYQRPQAP